MIKFALLMITSATVFFVTKPQLFAEMFEPSIQSSAHTKIIIRLPGKTSIPDDDLYKTITDPLKISKITKFIDAQLKSELGWRPEWDGKSIAPQPFLILAFYENNKYQRTFGVGKDFFSTVNEIDGYKIKRVSSETWKEFLGLLSITETEFNRLYREWDAPGPWKKKN